MEIGKLKSIAATTLMFCTLFSAAFAKEEPPKAAATAPKAVRDDAVKISNSVKVVKEIAALPKQKIPPVVLKEAKAVLIVPKAAKNSFMVSGGSAGGVLLVRDKAGTWSSPVFVTVSGGTLDWQIVGDPMNIIVLFKNPKHIEAILKGKITLDTKVAIEPGHVGSTMKGASAKVQKAEALSYVVSHSVFKEDVVVAGVTVQIDAAANDAFYSKPKVDAEEIVSGKVVKATEDVKALQKQLTDYGTK